MLKTISSSRANVHGITTLMPSGIVATQKASAYIQNNFTPEAANASPGVIAESALSLLVSGVLTDNPDTTLALNYLALVANRLYGRSNLHLTPLLSLLFFEKSPTDRLYHVVIQIASGNFIYLSLQMILPFVRS